MPLNSNWKPINGKYLVKPIERPKKTASGIVMVFDKNSRYQSESLYYDTNGIVIGVPEDNPLKLKLGDNVIVDRLTRTEFSLPYKDGSFRCWCVDSDGIEVKLQHWLSDLIDVHMEKFTDDELYVAICRFRLGYDNRRLADVMNYDMDKVMELVDSAMEVMNVERLLG